MTSPSPTPVIRVPITERTDEGTCDLLLVGPVGSQVSTVLPHAPQGLRLGVDLLPGATLDLRTRPDPGEPCEQGGLVVEVVNGPDAGRVIPLPPGRQTLGRDVIGDEALSRRHAELAVAATGVLARDAGSTNGTIILNPARDEAIGVPPGQPIRWDVDQELVAGSSRMVLRRRNARSGPAVAPENGRLPFAQPPRRSVSPQPQEFDLPKPPPRPNRPPFPLIAVVAPMLVALPMAYIMKSPMWIMFGLLSPVMMMANHVEARRRGTHAGKRSRARDVERRAQSIAQMKEVLASEKRWRTVAFPDITELLHHASTLGERLWERGPDDVDVLTVRVGLGLVTSRHTVRGTGGRGPILLQDSPVTISLRDTPVVGIVGPDAGRMVDTVLLQLVTLHSPVNLILFALGVDADRALVRWVPHVWDTHEARISVTDAETADALRSIMELVEERARAQTSSLQVRTPHVVVLVDDAGRWQHSDAFRRILAAGPAVGVSVLCRTQQREDLPTEVGVVIAAHRASTIQYRDAPPSELELDLIRSDIAEQGARALAPVKDITPAGGSGGALPSSIGLAEVLDLDLEDPDQLVDQVLLRWSSTESAAGVGMLTDGPWTVDLRRDGPHLLVAGTTGAGKSEFLRTFVTSLAIQNRPDEMAFVLVDYKGGAAFGACASLPHVTGVVTDLDQAGTARVIESLTTEIKHREALLGQAGAVDLDGYRQRSAGLPPLPRLVIVLDEFRVLAEEQPEALSDLVRLATVGRSLGLHLVLATQRPAGVVTAEMNANINLRIALRVQSTTESADVIGSPDAARLPVSVPGRALARIGGDPATLFQVASVGGGGSAEATLRCEPWIWHGFSPSAAQRDDDGDLNLTTLVDAVGRATRSLDIASVAPAWLPPLPPVVDLPAVTRGRHATDDLRLALGIADIPSKRAQPETFWQPGQDGHLIVSGTARSGKTGMLRTLLADAMARFGPRLLWLYAIDSTSGLSDLEAHPHVGAVIPTTDHERLGRLLAFLRREIAERSSGGSRPWIVIAVDSWEGLRAGRDDVEGLAFFDDFYSVLRDGPRAGVFVAVAGGRAALTGQLSTTVSLRMLLRPAERGDLTLAGLRTKDAPSPWPAGRGLLVGRTASPEPLLLQGFRVPENAPVHPTGDVGAPPIPLLPAEVATLEDGDGLGLGLGGDDVSRIAWDPRQGPLLVAGHPGTGRTGTLALVARQALADGWTVVANTDLHLGPNDRLVTPSSEDGFRSAMAATARPMMVVDDLDQLDRLWERCLEDILARPGEGPAIAAAGSTPILVGRFSGPVVEIRRNAHILLLGPALRADNDLVDVRLPSRYTRLPGRGFLVHRGRARQIQVARTGSGTPVG